MSPFDFYELSFEEATLLADNFQKRLEENYMLNFIACYNAMGAIQDGKKFKINHPFDEGQATKKNVPTKKQKEETLAFLQEKINEGR